MAARLSRRRPVKAVRIPKPLRASLYFSLASTGGVLGDLILMASILGASEETGFVLSSFKSTFDGTARSYAVFVPKRYPETRTAWPVVLFLHGYGESGSDVELLRRHGPIKEAMTQADFPFLVVAPQCPRVEYGRVMNAWADRAEDVMTVLTDVRSRYRVDASRMYLTGLSMGGFGAFALAARYPGLFAAVAPVCGGGNTGSASAYRGTPFWVFHGARDPLVPARFSTEMVEAMKAVGAPVKLTIYPEADHDSWTVTYANPELYTWFLSHSRKQ